MKYKLYIAAFIIVSPLFTYMACDKSTSDTNRSASKPCPEDVICTQQFAMVTVHISNATGNDITLDKSYTLRKSTGEKITPQQQLEHGTYTVLDDSYLEKLKNAEDDFIFTGMKDGKEIVKETYHISADCCHISKQSGETKIVIN